MHGAGIRMRHHDYAWRESSPPTDDKRRLQIEQTAKPYVDVVTNAKRGKTVSQIDEAALVNPHVSPNVSTQKPEGVRAETRVYAETQEHLRHHEEAVSDLCHVQPRPFLY